jgi:aryl-alcohol dehydrogenase-like predicted oxidoreductase
MTWASLPTTGPPPATSESRIAGSVPSPDHGRSDDYIITTAGAHRRWSLRGRSRVWLNTPDDHSRRLRPMSGTPEVTPRPGRPALPVARIALGCGSFGGLGSAPQYFGLGLTRDQAFALMDAAWEAGIRHFDTADAYGGGRSETAIGRWIAARGVRPGLTTKTHHPMTPGADHGLAPGRIARQLRSSLDRLGVDHVELYLAHDFDPDVPLAETFGAFEQARAEGTVGAYGVSNFGAARLEASLAAGAPQAIQNSYSLLDRQDSAGLLDLCAARGVAYLAFSPLAGGWLTGKYRRGEPFPPGSRMTLRPGPYRGLDTAATYDALGRLGEMAASRGISMAGLALAWLLADERVAQVVIGPGRPEHLAPVAEALAHPLTGPERALAERTVS